MAEGDPRHHVWMTQPAGQQHPSTSGELMHHRASPGVTSDNLSDDHSHQQAAGPGAPFGGGMLPQPPPQQHQIQLAGPPHGTPAPVSASPAVSKADAVSVGVMAAAVAATAAAAAAAPPAAPSAAVSSATASFVTSAVKGGWFIGDRGTEPGGAPGATVTVIPISLTPQGTTSNNTPTKNERVGAIELQPDCLQQRCSSPRGGEFEGRVVHVKPWCKTACTYCTGCRPFPVCFDCMKIMRTTRMTTRAL